jgi:hypothetical protein
LRTKLITLLITGMLLVSAASAVAQSPTQDAYGGVLGNQVSSGNSAQAAKAASGSSLPFTGFDVGLVALVGAGLVGVALVLRRATREDSNN